MAPCRVYKKRASLVGRESVRRSISKNDIDYNGLAYTKKRVIEGNLDKPLREVARGVVRDALVEAAGERIMGVVKFFVGSWEVGGAASVTVGEKSLDTACDRFVDRRARPFCGEHLAALAK